MIRPDEETGYVSIDVHGTNHFVRLRRPTIRQWCDWSQRAQALRARQAIARNALPAGGGDRLRMAVDIDLAGPVGELNVEIVQTLAMQTITIGPEDPALLRLHDLELTERLLTFWWECPLAPWPLNATPHVSAEDGLILAPSPSPSRKKDAPREISTNMSGAIGTLSVIYQAFAIVGLGAGPPPPVIDSMEIFQVAILLGRDKKADELDDHGGTVRHRGDGQESGRSFSRDPEQPLLFAPGANKAAAWKWLQAKRLRARTQAQRRAAAGEHAPPPKPKKQRTWRAGL